MNYKVGKLFEIIQLYIDNNVEDTQINDIFKLLSLDLSPCLQKKIIQLYISHFSNPEIQEEQKIKTLNNLLENNYIELSEYALNNIDECCLKFEYIFNSNIKKNWL